MKILHLGHDSHFVDFLVARFERIRPGDNQLIVVSEAEGRRPAEFTGPTDRIPPYADRLDEVLERAAAADVVIAHSMTTFASLVCAQLPPGVQLVWSGFGYDYYVGAAADEMIGPQTTRLVGRIFDGRTFDSRGRLVRDADALKLEPAALDVVRQAAAARTDVFSAPVDADLEVFRRAFPAFRGEYRQLNYGDVGSMVGAGDAVVTGDDILLGNSASWTNNHVEAFRLLAKCDLGSRRVVVPLTYGEASYRQAVEKAGAKHLGEHFVPLLDHLPIDEYLTLMTSFGVAVFNHRRQQGVGNIVAALHQGSVVCLDRRNPLFRWFRSRGVQVRPMSSLRSGLPEEPVTAEELARNRAVIAEMWGADRVDANVRALLDALESGGSDRKWRLPRRRR